MVIADVKATVQVDRTQPYRGEEPKPIDGAGEGTFERGTDGAWKLRDAAGRLYPVDNIGKRWYKPKSDDKKAKWTIHTRRPEIPNRNMEASLA